MGPRCGRTECGFSDTLGRVSSRPTPRRASVRPRAWTILVAVAVAAIAAIVILLTATGSSTPASHRMESMFQDDQYLLYKPTPTVVRTLDRLRSLGVDSIRVQVLWSAIAPAPTARAMPTGFDATNPAAYSAGAWLPYDRLVELALARHIAVNFDVTAPGPLWAMTRGAPNAKFATHYQPSPAAFGQFVLAVGRRYSGRYAPPGASASPLPRVSYWSIWNEPNQPGWLAPQWRAAAGQRVMESPALYRAYADGAFAALKLSGHTTTTDRILIGELAPVGLELTGAETPIPPLSFLRAMYCVNAAYRPLEGQAAEVLGCPPHGDPSGFASANPALFDATAFAHHPYDFALAPNVQYMDPNFVSLADLPRLERALDQVFAAYGVHRQLPLYLTEYGYVTKPPNPFRNVTPRQQSLFLDQAQYMAWRDPRVRALSQFLLYDSEPDSAYPRGSFKYWSTFQTGLLFARGKPKPAYRAYRLPIFIPEPVFAHGSQVLVWGMLRLAPNGTAQRATIDWRAAHGRYQTIATVSTKDPDGVFSTRLQLPGTGVVRIAWTSARGQHFYSRASAVREH